MKKILSIIILLILLLLSSCSRGYTEKSVFALDTVITFHTPVSDISEYTALIKDYEKVFSRTDVNSELYRLNKSTEFAPSQELLSLIEYSLEVCVKTDGAFDITAAALAGLWDVASQNPVVPDGEEIAATLGLCGYEKISVSGGTVKKPLGTELDLGGIAKGYVAEKTIQAIRADGCTGGFISFGGNIAVIGAKSDGSPWIIGIKDPRNTADILGTVEMSDGFLSVSGDYERYFIYDNVRYHHIFDMNTGYPSKSGIISAAVISEDGTLSDALSTALFVMGAEKALALYESGEYRFEAVLMLEDKTVIATPGAGFTLSGNWWKLKK